MSGFTWYPGKERQLDAAVARALEMTGEAVRTDLVTSGTVPYAEDSEANRRAGVVPGELQSSVHTDCSRSRQGAVSVVSSTPYARRLYYHPEYRYFKGVNRLAGGAWYEPYLTGGKRGFAARAFARFLKRSGVVE